MTNEALKQKEEFIRQKKGARSDADVTAQQLINIYRQLSILGDEATQRYNQQLLEDVNADVLASLKTIPGGEEVRDYYNFLTQTQIKENDETDALNQKDDSSSLLPAAEQISPIWENFGMGMVQMPVQTRSFQPMPTFVQSSLPEDAPELPDIDIKALQSDIDDVYEKQKQAIMQALNFIVIDSDVEKMHKNLKNAISEVDGKLNELKESLATTVDGLQEKINAATVVKRSVKNQMAKKEAFRIADKVRRHKNKHKFSVDITDEED